MEGLHGTSAPALPGIHQWLTLVPDTVIVYPLKILDSLTIALRSSIVGMRSNDVMQKVQTKRT